MRRFRWLMVGWLLALSVSGAFATVAPGFDQAVTVAAQGDLTQRVDELERRFDRVESRVDKNVGAAVAILFGAFCALWAQNTRRNPWAWFFLGVFFNIITVFVLLAKNAEDQRAGGETASRVSRAVVWGLLLGILLVLTLAFLTGWGR